MRRFKKHRGLRSRTRKAPNGWPRYDDVGNARALARRWLSRLELAKAVVRMGGNDYVVHQTTVSISAAPVDGAELRQWVAQVGGSMASDGDARGADWG